MSGDAAFCSVSVSQRVHAAGSANSSSSSACVRQGDKAHVGHAQFGSACGLGEAGEEEK